MSENISFAAVFFPSLAVVLVFAMKYLASIAQAKGRLAQEEAYREIAAQAAAAQAHTAAALAASSAVLADIQARLGSLEQILKQVE
jgi:Tfp pilus assembly protein PilO